MNFLTKKLLSKRCYRFELKSIQTPSSYENGTRNPPFTMVNLKSHLKISLNVFVILTVASVLYYIFQMNHNIGNNLSTIGLKQMRLFAKDNRLKTYNVWFIFTKVWERSPLTSKFGSLLINLLNVTSVPLHLHLLVDDASKIIARKKLKSAMWKMRKNITYSFYDVEQAAEVVEDIVNVMTPHFSSKPGTYYSDALFYLSLGMHRIAPEKQEKAVMLDCDVYFKQDIALLFEEFKRFKEGELFGLAPEQSPVYRHVLYMYRAKHNTTFGDYRHPNYTVIGHSQYPKAFPGYNSGVILLNLKAIKRSRIYPKLLTNTTVTRLATKYMFRGHLGDQDFYTLLGHVHPELIHEISCGFNRQLCVWWRNHGYKEVFDFYFRCDDPIVILHGNCNSKIPK